MKYLVALLLFSVPLHAQTGVWKASPLPVLPGGSYSLIDFADSVNGWIFSNNGRYVLTSDGGETWSAVRSLPDSMTVVQAKLYDGDTGIVFVSVRRIGGSTIYLVRTTDRGAAWDVLKLPAHVFGPGSVSIANRRIIACMGDSGGILRTTDLGSTWDTLARSVGPSRGEIGVMKNGRIFAWSPLAGMLNSGWLVTSADSGKTWSPVAPQSYMSSSWGRIYNENLASFALGVERIEGLLQPFLRRFPCVNRTACLFGGPARCLLRFSHCAPHCSGSPHLPLAAQRSADPTIALR